MAEKTGVIQFYNERPFGNKTLYSFKFQGENELYRIGEKDYGDVVGVDKNVTITFTTKDGAKGTIYNVDSIVAAAAPPPAANNSSGGGSKGGNKRSGGGTATQNAIQYQSSRKDAIEVLNAMIEVGAVKLGAKTKVQENYVAYMGYLDQITAGFVADIDTQGAVTRYNEALEAGDGFEGGEDAAYDDD